MPFNTNTDIWLAGAFAAFTVDLLIYPLDTLKTRIQSPDYTRLYTYQPAPTRQGVPSLPRPSPTLFRNLYQGVGSIILLTLPSAGAFFTTYEGTKHLLSDYTPANSTIYLPRPAIHAVASGVAECVSCAILTPAEVVKQNAQVVMKKKKGGTNKSPTVQVWRELSRHPRRLWRGYAALTARNLPFTGLQFPMFEGLKGWFLDRRKEAKRQKLLGDGEGVLGEYGNAVLEEEEGIVERAMITSMSAGIAGCVAAWVTTPIDVAKTRIMLSASHDSDWEKEVGKGEASERKVRGRRSGLDVAKEVWRSQGVKGLFRGGTLRAGWTAVGSGLYLGCYEGGRFYLEGRRKDIAKEEGERIG